MTLTWRDINTLLIGLENHYQETQFFNTINEDHGENLHMLSLLKRMYEFINDSAGQINENAAIKIDAIGNK